jgi:4-amino-4-deoxy-L-arabinose transferase
MTKGSLAVVGLFVLVYILPLGVRPLAIPDETRYAEIPREMIDSGDWAVPHLVGLRYFEKPVLGYWLNAVAMKVCGQNAFAVRLPSALCAGLSALMVFILIRRSVARDLALAGAAVFLTCGLVFGIGVFSILDSPFSAFVTAAMTGFYCAYGEPRPARKALYLALCGLACGLAFLTKGFLAFVLPVVAIVPFLVWQRRWKALLTYPWIPLLVAIAVVLPWGLWIHAREKDFWHYFFWEEHIRRFFSDTAQHAEPFWYYVPVLLGGALPWAVLLGAVIKGLRARPWDTLIRFALCWAACIFLFFSASRGKLATYLLPCFAPVAILLCAGMETFLSGAGNRGHARMVYLCAALLCVLAIAAPVVGSVLPDARIYGPGETWKWGVLAGGLLFYAAMLALSERQPTALRKLAFYCAAPAILLSSVALLIPERVEIEKAPEAFLVRHAPEVRPDALVVSDEGLAPAVCWTYRRQDVVLLDRGGEMAYGLGYSDSKDKLLTADQFNGLVSQRSRTRPITLIVRTEPYVQWREQLAKPDVMDTDGHYVFAVYHAARPAGAVTPAP